MLHAWRGLRFRLRRKECPLVRETKDRTGDKRADTFLTVDIVLTHDIVVRFPFLRDTVLRTLDRRHQVGIILVALDLRVLLHHHIDE